MNDGLKQRLVGALVLLALAVIFVPVLFKDQSSHVVDTQTRIPDPPTIERDTFEPPRRPVDITPAPEPDTMFLSDAGSDGPFLDEEPIDTEQRAPESEAGSAPAAESAPPAEPGLTDQGIPEAWVVQVGSFRSAEAAARLRDRLQGDGYAAYMRTLDTDNGQVSRVLIGPKIDRDQALTLKAEMDDLLAVDSLVLRFQP